MSADLQVAGGNLEPWLDRKKLAGHYSCSVRSIELALSEGMPSEVLFGRRKMQVSAVEPWLRANGYFGGKE